MSELQSETEEIRQEFKCLAKPRTKTLIAFEPVLSSNDYEQQSKKVIPQMKSYHSAQLSIRTANDTKFDKTARGRRVRVFRTFHQSNVKYESRI